MFELHMKKMQPNFFAVKATENYKRVGGKAHNHPRLLNDAS